MNHDLNEVETRAELIDPGFDPTWRGNHHFGACVLFYALMYKFPFRSVNTLFILGRNTPAMPLNDAQIGGFFYARSSKGMTAFTKPALAISAQLQQWIDRGLTVADQSDAEQYLRNIGYYRLSAYSLPFQNGDPDHRFGAGVCFDDIRKLYVFDRELRLLVLDAIERVEVAFRSQFNNHMAQSYGAHWYLDEKYFIAKYDHKALLAEIELLGRRSKEVFVKHYRSKYTDPRLPPSWMVTELLTFGQLSIVFANLINFSDQKAIAKGLNTSAELLRSWMQSISYVRNTCAHHSRLWNRELGTAPMVPKKPKGAWINMSIVLADPNVAPHTRLYLLLVTVEYLLQAVNPTSTWHERLRGLMQRNPQVSKAHMGMPDGWIDDPFWRFENDI